MTDEVRKELDALDLLMQDHREVESLFRKFEHLQQQNSKETGRVVASACAELKIHDALETAIFYAAVGEAADDEKIDRLVADAENEHDAILDLIEKLEQTRADDQQRDAHFKALAAHVKQHVLTDETERFPLVRKMRRLDLEAVTAAMKKRKTALMAEMLVSKADAEPV
ncbi:MAG: hemerythrin domain-containing protein [Betaproteobacteria bacterium]